jgi:SSS family transporter
MRKVDWAVLIVTLGYIILYGLWRSRGTQSTHGYLLAGRSMPWYAMALSIMATQASAITFISTTGQAYVDGMRFVQFYFGLPLAMILISAIAVPIYRHANVYTAYEYLEQRFDLKTRTLVSFVFLIQRGLAVGIALYAPAVVLTVIFGWSDTLTTVLMGVTVITYTVLGGIKAVTWTDVQQMTVMVFGLAMAAVMAVVLLPQSVSFSDAIHIAGAAGRINPVTFNFDWNDRYNLFSGLLGGMFLALAYFGCDQSQVQRFLTGSSVTQSRLSLLFNAVAKIPMQFCILFTGALVFVFFTFEPPPLLFQKVELQKIQSSAAYAPMEQRYQQAFEKRKQAAVAFNDARHAGDTALQESKAGQYRAAQKEFDSVRSEGAALVEQMNGKPGFNDTNYVFLTFVTKYLPPGVVGLVIAVIFGAAMSTNAGEINSLATVTVIDVYKRHFRPEATDGHYLWVSRVATAFWGVYAIFSAELGKNIGSLVEAVNMLGSFFYGGILGVFVLAMFFKKVNGHGAFFGVLIGEAVIFAVHFAHITSFLWYNVIGCIAVVVAGMLVSKATGGRAVAAVG